FSCSQFGHFIEGPGARRTANVTSSVIDNKAQVSSPDLLAARFVRIRINVCSELAAMGQRSAGLRLLAIEQHRPLPPNYSPPMEVRSARRRKTRATIGLRRGVSLLFAAPPD